MVVTKGEIKRWLKREFKPEDDDAIVKDFILDKMAVSIKRSRPLPKGRCQSCGGYYERLVPVQMKICKKCALKFFNNAGFLRVVQGPIFEEWYCDNCLGKCWMPMVVNPYICGSCSKKIGRRHQFGIKKLKPLQSLKLLRM